VDFQQTNRARSGREGDVGMSREWTYYGVTCRKCGNFARLGIWSDDLKRWDYTIVGFRGRVQITGPRPEDLSCAKCKASLPEIKAEVETK
jgi:hypothetical protein